MSILETHQKRSQEASRVDAHGDAEVLKYEAENKGDELQLEHKQCTVSSLSSDNPSLLILVSASLYTALLCAVLRSPAT